MAPPRIWLLTGPRPGERAQQRRLAEALGEPYLEKPVFTPGAPPGDRFGWRAEDAADGGLVAPWPALAISFGKTLQAALWLRQASGGRTRLVHLGRPRGRLAEQLDLIVPMPQDAMAAAPRVLRLKMPLNAPQPPTTEALAAARRRLTPLPRPWTLLAIGGSTRHFTLDAAALTATLAQLMAAKRTSGGSLLVSSSPRTPPALARALADWLAASGGRYELNLFDARQPHNAYAEYLALADEIVVTGDTASMIADGWRSGRPVRVVPLQPTPRLLLERALRRRLPRLMQALVQRGIWAPAIELDGWIAGLADRGWIGLFGQSAPRQCWTAALDDDLARVRDRVLALLPAAR